MAEENVATQHPEYQAAAGWWQRCRDTTAGSDAVKAGDYLPRLPGMGDEDFAFYKERAQYLNAMGRTVGGLSGAVFQQQPDVEVPDAVKSHLEDLTLRGEPLDVVANRLVTELLTPGRYCILLDQPVVKEGQAQPPNARPYWITIPAERVINWRTGPVGDDPEQLVMVVIQEDAPDGGDRFSHETTRQYRELALMPSETGAMVYQSRIWKKGEFDAVAAGHNKDIYVAGPWSIPTRRGAPLPFIPFTFVGTEGVTPDVTRPPLLDLADVAIGHYRNSADHEHSLFWVSCPTPWVSGAREGAVLRIGSSVAWDLDKDGKAGMLEHSGEGIGAIREAMTAKERQMASLGARMLDDASAKGAETATAVRLHHSGDASSLRKTSAAASAALTRVLRWHVWWFTGTGDIPLTVRVELAKEFFQVKATPEEVKTALAAVQNGSMSFETFYAFLEKGGWTREGVTADEEKAAIEAEQPRDPAPVPGDATPDEDELPPPGQGKGGDE